MGYICLLLELRGVEILHVSNKLVVYVYIHVVYMISPDEEGWLGRGVSRGGAEL